MRKSFRDPAGFVQVQNHLVYRAIRPENKKQVEALLSEPWYQILVNSKLIQNSIWIEDGNLDANFYWIKHAKFDFPLFPHQISAEQLYLSALLTLDIAEKALENNWILKDASAWNIVNLYGGQQFCDITSFEPYDNSMIWNAYGQFCRHYVITLLLFKYLGLSPAEMFTLNRDGITPNKAAKLLGMRAFFNIAAWETVFLPSLIKNNQSVNQIRTVKSVNFGQNKAVLRSTFKRLKKYIHGLKPSKNLDQSTWSDYEEQRQHYSAEDLERKTNFVERSLKKISGAVLDLGCNQGEYAFLAASQGLNVIACDFDENALIKLQAKVTNEKINVMFLNLAYPTPSIGWRNEEHLAFIKQSASYFDLVLCLGLVHHLLVSERIPLDEILDLLGSISQKYVLIEWVNTNDQKFSEIASTNADLYSHISEQYFELEVSKKYKVVDSLSLDFAKRKLYLLQKLV